MFNNGLIGVLSCEIYVGWVTFEREMYTEFIDARNRLDEETDRFSDLPKATNVAGQLQCTTHNHAVASGFTATQSHKLYRIYKVCRGLNSHTIYVILYL